MEFTRLIYNYYFFYSLDSQAFLSTQFKNILVDEPLTTLLFWRRGEGGILKMILKFAPVREEWIKLENVLLIFITHNELCFDTIIKGIYRT